MQKQTLRNLMLDYLKDPSLVEKWFNTPLPSMQGKTPNELCTTDVGCKALSDYLKVIIVTE